MRSGGTLETPENCVRLAIELQAILALLRAVPTDGSHDPGSKPFTDRRPRFSSPGRRSNAGLPVWPRLNLVVVARNDGAVEKRVVGRDHALVESLRKLEAHVLIAGFLSDVVVLLWRIPKVV